MNTISTAQKYLLQYNIKPSVQRIAIVEYMMENRIHPTADEIYNALYVKVPTLSKTTVYNTMKLFVERRAVLPLVIDDKNIRFDINVSSHAHFQCCRCNRIFDIAVEETGILEVKEIDNFIVTESHLYYRGYCKNCNGGDNLLNHINQ